MSFVVYGCGCGCHSWWFVVTGGDGIVIVVVVLFFLVFFFFLCCVVVDKIEWWLWPVVVVVVAVVVVVVVADGRSRCGWCCGCFLGSKIYYFIVLKSKFLAPLLWRLLGSSFRHLQCNKTFV